VNITCPWCGTADPSAHLGIEEATGAYYCLRSQPPHAGYSTKYLLGALNVPSFQIDALLRDFSDDSEPTRTPRYHETTDWDRFQSAADHPAALAYLKEERGIDPPAVIARRYDMRFTTVGRHSWRILLPLHLNFAVAGWTGRAITDRQTPRYQANDPTEGASLYVPVYPTEATRIIVVVEGPFDAIAITDAFHPTHEIIAVAVIGLNIGPVRRQHLADIINLAQAPRVLLTLDNDQGPHIVANFKAALAQATGIPYPRNFPLPPAVKDAGDMSRTQIRAWLKPA
jgi:DNA primase